MPEINGYLIAGLVAAIAIIAVGIKALVTSLDRKAKERELTIHPPTEETTVPDRMPARDRE